MPKNHKPGRPAKNYDPRRGKKPSAGSRFASRSTEDAPRREGEQRTGAPRRPGSLSPKHRGYRPAEEGAPKKRWTAQERAGRDEARDIRARAHGRDVPRGGERFAHDERPSRREYDRRDDRFGARADRPRGEREGRSPWEERSGRDRREERGSRFPERSSRDERGSRDDRSTRGGWAPRDDRRPQRDDRRDERRPVRDQRRPSRSGWNEKPAARFEEREDTIHERLNATSVDADSVSEKGFGDLGLGGNIVRTLAELGAERPFPIQAATIPSILEGRDVLGRGRTGSGKTIAFGAPLVESLLRARAGQKREQGRSPQAIILAPTRELALQIDRTVQPIARSVGLFTTQIYGGVPQARQVGALKKGVDIVIGTPGRIEDLHEQGKLDLSQVRIAVLDEADHMCELGFLEPVQRILRLTADDSQKLLFSATLDAEVEALVSEFLAEPAVYEVAGEDQASGTIDHRVLVIDHRDKAEILTSLVDREGKTLVFARTRAYADQLADIFDEAGVPAVALHGDLNQAKRQRNLERLAKGRVKVLVATDVAARGIHVDDIDLVIQADAPDEHKTYLHRAGRTGRAGREGRVVTVTTRQRRRRLAELLERAQIRAPFEEAQLGDEVIEEIAGRMTLADLTA